jgi:hypothetical protein
MQKTIYSEGKGLDGKSLWILMSDGSMLINQAAVQSATIRRINLKT